ncbi:MAG: RDD family protein [Paracoccaceae bacterium]
MSQSAASPSTAQKSTAAKKARRERAKAEYRMVRDFLPPEGVPLKFEVAGLGMRFAAQFLDITLTLLAIGAFLLLLAVMDILPNSAMLTLFALLFFVIRAPYYILTEILWNGQTLGKRITRIRVIGADGRSLRPYQVAVRNMMKEVEVFYPGTMLVAAAGLGVLEVIILLIWITILLAVPLMNRKRQRLGDMIANTYVVYQPQALLLPDVATRAGAEQKERFQFLAHQLDHYGAFELQTLERVLQVDAVKFTPEALRRHQDNLQAIFDRVAAKIEYTERVQPSEIPEFLEAFYVAQRRYLETRKLFGDAREDKFHQEDDGQNRDR